MKKLMLVSAVALAAASAPATSAVIVTTANGDAPYPGYSLIFDFESDLPTGALVGNGSVQVAPGVPNQSAAPAGTPVGGRFLTVPTPNDAGLSSGTATLNLGGEFNKVSFYWGSIDTYNTLELLDTNGGVISTITGGGLPAPTSPNGDQVAPTSNRRVFIVNSTPSIAALRFTSEGFAFELDNVAAAVPEPATWAMMIGGFGMMGFAARRRSTARTVLA